MKWFLLSILASCFSLSADSLRMDIDQDGSDDVGFYHWETGDWYVFGSTQGAVTWNWGGRTGQPVIGDFDGDGIMDPAVFDATTTKWSIYNTGSNTVRTEFFGRPGMVPVVGDYDGDGTTDLALFERETAQWVIRGSLPGADRVETFGWPEARPVPADYDGDGMMDLAVYHRHTGTWYIFGSTSGFQSLVFGFDRARAVPGDYDGDGTDDIAVYTPSNGNWQIFGSFSGYRIVNWGFPQARPVPADYDGDGVTDLAVWDRATATWYIWQSRFSSPRIFVYGWERATPLASYQNGGIEGGVVLALGDSITYGVGSSNPPMTGYPARLEQELGPAFGGMFDVINAGIPGETTDRGLARLPGLLSFYRPEWTLLMEGTNDHFFNRSYSSIQSNLLGMVNTSRAFSASPIVANTPPVMNAPGKNRSMQAARIQGFNPILENVMSANQVPVVNAYGALASIPSWPFTVMDRASGNHPNDAGYEVLKNAFLEAVRQGIMNGQLY